MLLGRGTAIFFRSASVFLLRKKKVRERQRKKATHAYESGQVNRHGKKVFKAMKEPQYKPNALSSARISQCTNNIWHGRTSSTCFYRFTLFYGKMIDAILHKV
jgi:hypothetical protein